jgi:hypothetical protein
MKVLFILCEGLHDAQFIARLLTESGDYSDFNKKLGDYPKILRSFISGKLKKENVDSIKIGHPQYPLVPVCALYNQNADSLVLPISIGGIDKFKDGVQLVDELSNDFSPDVLLISESSIDQFGVLFVFDADSRGKQETINLFRQNDRYGGWFDDISDLQHAKWCSPKDFPLAVFVFTGNDGKTGTLEEVLIKIFQEKNHTLVKDAERLIDSHFQKKNPNGDPIAHEAKKKKGVLTICGQQEKNNVGSALTVIVRDSTLLSGAFDFADSTTQWSQLLTVINSSFTEYDTQ